MMSNRVELAHPIPNDRVILILLVALGLALPVFLVIDKPILFIAAIPGLMIALAILRSPILGLYGIALAVPIDVAGNLISVTKTFNISVAWVFTSLTLASWAINSFADRRVPTIPREVGIWLLYLILGGFSLISAREFDRGVEEIVRTVQNILFFLVVINLIQTKEQLRTVLILLVTATVLTFVYAISQKILPTNSFDERALGMLAPGAVTFGIERSMVDTQGYESLERTTGTTAHANVLAYNCVYMLPFLFAYLHLGRSLSARFVAWVAILISFAAFAMTLSRGGFLVLGFALVLLVMTGLLEITISRIVVATAAGVGAIPFLPTGYIERVLSFSSYFVSNSGSLSGRLGLWEGAIRAMLEHPFGLGIGNEYGLFREAYWKPEMAQDPSQLATTMNTYVQIGMEVGVLGVILFVLFQIMIFRGLFKGRSIYKANGDYTMELLGTALFVMLASTLAAWMTIEFLRMGAKNVWLILGCTVVYYRLAQQEAQQFRQRFSSVDR